MMIDFVMECQIEAMNDQLRFLSKVIEYQDGELQEIEAENEALREAAETAQKVICDVNRENKMLRERLEAAQFLIEGLQDKFEVARRHVADYDMVVSQRNLYFSECERLKGELNEGHK